MRLTPEQYKTLSQYEDHFRKAINGHYLRYPGVKGVNEIYEVYSVVMSSSKKLCHSCSRDIYRMVLDLGKIYFQDKAEMEEAKPKRKKKS